MGVPPSMEIPKVVPRHHHIAEGRLFAATTPGCRLALRCLWNYWKDILANILRKSADHQNKSELSNTFSF